MSFFDQAKLAAGLMKNMDPSQMKAMMEQAKEAQKMLDEQIRKIVAEEIEKRDLVTRKDVEELLKRKA